MNRYNLSKRLTKVVDLVEPAAFLADIGCDHGFLSIELVAKGRVKEALCTDINEGPLERAGAHIKDYCLEDKISTLLSDGLTEIIKDKDARRGFDCAAICGMGGLMGVKIMYEADELFKAMKYIYLQLQSDIELVRIYLEKCGYEILFEDMVFEDGKYYTVMKVTVADTAIKAADVFSDFETLPGKLKNFYDSLSADESVRYKYPFYEDMDKKIYKEFLEFMLNKYRTISSYLPEDSDRKDIIKKEYDIMEKAYELFNGKEYPV
ncbi:MAG: class I SAM-dependent methyltransferase [Lachnospiraceae bacterium]|nr:class I SAM-dependent methyltransferase [Lachnospiraceae bacterium]